MELNIIREQVDRLGRPGLPMLRREIARHERREAYVKLALGALAGLLAVTGAIIIVTNLWVTLLQVDGSSMNPLLRMDEVILAVNTDNPAKNDVIAFYHNNKLHIKRVIAAAGELVNIDDNGMVTVNGRPLAEPYVAQPSRGSCDIPFPYQVPDGTVFVLGDNRPSSLDSRDSRFGPVPKEQIVGRVVFRLWPLRGGSKL
ncbi:MAG: signal peptidase I [Oscillospiraceae bacterium]|nr:signal peptidase I [Oscillospiraceae bacterium]